MIKSFIQPAPARLNATGLRWIAELADFKFNIRYRPGKLNARMPMNIDDYMKTCSEEVNRDAFQATVCGAKVQVEQFQTPFLFPPEITRADVSLNQASINLKTAQNDDADIDRVITLKIANTYLSPHERKQESHTVQQLLREWNKLKVGTDGVLYRLAGTVRQVVLPGRLRQQVYKELHIMKRWVIWVLNASLTWLENDFLASHETRYNSLRHESLSLLKESKTRKKPT